MQVMIMMPRILFLCAVAAQAVPLDLVSRREPTESHILAEGSVVSTSIGYHQQVQSTTATAAENRGRISIDDILSSAPVPFDPRRSYPRETEFSMDEIPEDLQKEVDACEDHKHIFTMARMLENKDEIIERARWRKIHPDDVLLLGMKLRRKALLKHREEMRKKPKPPPATFYNLSHHYKRMRNLATEYGSRDLGFDVG